MKPAVLMVVLALLLTSSTGGAGATTSVNLIAPDSVSEDADSIELRASRGGDATVEFDVDYVAVPNRTAVPSVNFLPGRGTLTFAAGQQDAFFHVPIFNDGVVVPEGFTTFGVYLTNATAGVTVGTNVAEVSVQDIQWPTTLDLEYHWTNGPYFLESGPNGQLVFWNGAELVRVNADDSIGARFPLVFDQDPGYPYGGIFVVQQDGKILVSSEAPFTRINGAQVPRPGFARLNADGSLDTTFVPAVIPAAISAFFLPLVNGRILFGEWGRTLAALQPNGDRDSSFQSDSRLSVFGYLTEDAQGKLLVAASPPGEGAQRPASILRLNQDGSLDSTFTPAPTDSQEVRKILPQPDGTILVEGAFNTIGGIARPGLARLNPNGTVDKTFKPAVSWPGSMTLDREKVLIWTGQTIDRLNTDGSLDKRFAMRLHRVTEAPPRIEGMTLQGGRLRIHGQLFGQVNGLPTPTAYVARLLLDEAPETAAAIIPSSGFEGMGQATITVRRLGDVRGPATLTYKTRDGSAKAGKDYTAVSGTVSFAPLEMEKTFMLPILDDTEYSSDRSLELVLGLVNGVASVGPPATFIIHDDEVRIQSWKRFGNSSYLSFNAVPGGQYLLEASTDLRKWAPLDPGDSWQLSTNDYYGEFDFNSVSQPHRFFRIKRGSY
jgi:uncharacterized delta-60 repeat protein